MHSGESTGFFQLGEYAADFSEASMLLIFLK